MRFQFKTTVWEEVGGVATKDEQKVLKAIKDGSINSANDIFNFLDTDGNLYCEVIEGTSEQMSVNENVGCSTIEVLDGFETIFDNTKNK